LSISAWCRLHGVNYQQFNYWKKRLSNEQEKTADSNSFVELESSSDSSGIEIVFNEISIRLEKEFDSRALAQCLQTLKGMKC
jgi:transposase-like protein